LDGKVDVAVPSEGFLLDHSFVFRFKGSWKFWPDILRAIKLDENADVLHTTVSTVDTERLSQLMQLHVQHGRPLMLRGPKDSGNYVYIFFLNLIEKYCCLWKLCNFLVG